VKLIAGGERGGKSFSAAMYALPRVLDMDLLWIVAADYKQTKPEFEYLYNALAPAGFIERASIPSSDFQPRNMKLKTGCVIQTVTAADEKKIGAVAPDGIIGAEAAQLSYSIYQRLRARTAQKRGWLLLEGTFENSEDWYAELWEKWLQGGPYGEKSFSLPSWANLAVFPGGREDPEMRLLESNLGSAKFLERHGGIPSVPATVVFPEFSYEKHTGDFAFNPQLPVQVAIDPGYASAYAVLALQWDSGRVYVVDEVYLQRTSARDVVKEVRKRPWAKYIDPTAAGVIDRAGFQHQGMESHAEIWAAPKNKGGMGWVLQQRYVPIEDGIERLRTYLSSPTTGEPRLYYNSESTKESQKEYRRYRYPETDDGKAVREKPIDSYNHSIKALTYWLVYRYGWTGVSRRSVSDARFGFDATRKAKRRKHHQFRIRTS